MNKLYTHYSTDECTDNDLLTERLNELQEENKIEFTKIERFLIKIVDIDLSETEEQELIKFLDSIDIYPCLEYEDDDDDDVYNSYDDDDDSYTGRGKGRRSSYDDDYDY